MTYATEYQADLEYARNAGYDHQESAWILSDRDVWYANPFYQGPAQRHPEDDCYDENDAAYPVLANDEATRVVVVTPRLWNDEDMPF